jgi:hypothetical protein
VGADVRVNGGSVDSGPDWPHGRFRSAVWLHFGRNEIKVVATAAGYKPAVRRFVVTRKRPSPPPQPDSPYTLDLGTAAYVTYYSEEAYSNCMEGDCSYRAARCFAVTSNRVDCVVAVANEGKREECGVIVSTYLDGDKVVFGAYGCRGAIIYDRLANDSAPLMPLTRKRFVRPRNRVQLRRFKASSTPEPNAYGRPRFDARSDRFTG